MTRACCPIVTKDEHAGGCRRLPVVRIRLLPCPSQYSSIQTSERAATFYRPQSVGQNTGGRTEICASGRKFLVPGPAGLRRGGYGMPRSKRSLPITRDLSRSAISQARHLVYTAGWGNQTASKRTVWVGAPACALFYLRWRQTGAVTMVVLQRPLFKCHNLQVHWLKHCFPCGRCDRIFIGRPRRETQAHRRKTPGKRICNNGRMGNRKIPFLAWRLVRPDAAARSRRGPDAAKHLGLP